MSVEIKKSQAGYAIYYWNIPISWCFTYWGAKKEAKRLINCEVVVWRDGKEIKKE